MNAENMKAAFADEAFVKSLFELETAAEVQAALKEKGVELTGEEATVFTISSTSLLRMHRGMASTSPNALKSKHLPSITGIPASGPISPRPSTAVPSVTTATRLLRRVRA